MSIIKDGTVMILVELSSFGVSSTIPMAGTGTIWKAHRKHETGTRKGMLKGRKRLRMDRATQQHKSLCEGDCEWGNYLCI